MVVAETLLFTFKCLTKHSVLRNKNVVVPIKRDQNIAKKIISSEKKQYLKGLGHAILGNFVFKIKIKIRLIMSSKRQIGRPRVFHLQNHGHITTENDFPAE